MIKIYKDDYDGKTGSIFKKDLKKYIQSFEDHKKTVGVPAPRKIKLFEDAINHGYEYINKTKDQEKQELEELENKKYSDEKLAAQTTPSDKYQQFRKEEYPPIGEGMDSLVKWAKQKIDENEPLPDDLQSYVQKCLDVKAKYPKP